MYDGQLEMSFASNRSCQSGTRRQRRVTRARWWFQRMRQVVERATDWQAAPAGRPEQIWLAGTHRLPEVGSQATAEAAKQEQQQVCE